MNNKIKYTLLGLIAIFIIIQLIPVDRKNPPIESGMEITASPEVINILSNSCYDCHSFHTEWPAYSYIAPVSWMVASDVEEARRMMNFSEWNKFSDRKKAAHMEEIGEKIEEDEMPPAMYLLMHANARLSDSQKQTMYDWARSGPAIRDTLETENQ